MKHINLVKTTSFLVVSTLALTVMSAGVRAESCTTQYGGGQYGTTCVPTNLNVNKQVRNPVTGEFWENLQNGDATYSPGAEVIFRLVINNADNQSFGEVFVKDTLPDKLKDGAVASENKSQVTDESYNSSTRELTFKIHDLKAGEGREVKIKATVVDAGAFPSGTNPFCDVTNKARVEANGRSDEDTAKLCVQLNVLGKVTLPKAGVEDYMPLMPILALTISGVGLIFKKGK